MARVKVPEAYRRLAKLARKAGWTITVTRSGHLAWRPPSGAPVFTPCSPSDWRSVRNNLAELRRAGLER